MTLDGSQTNTQDDISMASPAVLFAIGLLSAAALAYEILLIRLFAVVHWQHLVSTAISLALLGYGTSGTFLTLFAERLKSNVSEAFVVNAALFGVSAIVSVATAQSIPLDPQALAWDLRQLVYLIATFLLLSIPFFAAANCIGLALWSFPRQVSKIYGIDLIGAGLGACLVPLALVWFSPESAMATGATAGLMAALAASLRARRRSLLVATSCVAFALSLWSFGVEFRPAAYKDLSRSLAVMGAEVDYDVSGNGGRVTVVHNQQVPMRLATGLSLNAQSLPPEQLAVFVDADLVGALGRFDGDRQTGAYLEYVVSALPYVLTKQPRVAIVGAGVGERVHQALQLGARHVTAIEPNPLLPRVVCEQYADWSGRACDPEQVTWVKQTARTVFAVRHRSFDLVTIDIAADPSGIEALTPDHQLTREGIASTFGSLDQHGMLLITGPTRLPPRMALRMLQTVRDMLSDAGLTPPGEHIAMLRGWQQFALLAAKRPINKDDTTSIRTFAKTRGFDLVWLPGITEQDANRFQRLRQAQYFLAARDALTASVPDHAPSSDSRDMPLTAPASDDQPYPHRFTGWRSWFQTMRYGDQTQRAAIDTGLQIGIVTLAAVSLIGVVLIVLPLALNSSVNNRASTQAGAMAATLLYFGVLGAAFIIIEITWIDQLQRFLGHPVYATSVVLGVFLVFAGLGSLWSSRFGSAHPLRLVGLAAATIATLCAGYVAWIPDVLIASGSAPFVARIAIAIVMLAPLAFAMGIPFPVGLRLLGNIRHNLVPWAWGINGCTSVIGAASVPLITMQVGFSGILSGAALCYLSLPIVVRRFAQTAQRV